MRNPNPIEVNGEHSINGTINVTELLATTPESSTMIYADLEPRFTFVHPRGRLSSEAFTCAVRFMVPK